MAPSTPPIVDLVWAQTHDPAAVLCDVRWYLDGRSGRAAFEDGHLPGAVFVDLDTALAGPASASAGRHPLPSPDAFAAAMSAAGIGDTTPVVAYDDQGGMVAARLVWMLRAVGHPAAVLDGGLSAWTGELEREPARRRVAASFTPRPWPAACVASADDLVDAQRAGALVLDAREPERYRGDSEPIDARAGHIPGAVSAPFRANLDHVGRFHSPSDLAARYAGLGAVDGREVVVYCGSGVSACHDLLALERAGVTSTRLYAGSWSQWSADAGRAVATGDEPGQW
jgi:thiosulfate/3-mercaptopyruvate sulfurtransferase